MFFSPLIYIILDFVPCELYIVVDGCRGCGGDGCFKVFRGLCDIISYEEFDKYRLWIRCRVFKLSNMYSIEGVKVSIIMWYEGVVIIFFFR